MTWRLAAACHGMNPTVFHPNMDAPRLVARAKAVCANCPVRTDCLNFATAEQISVGIYGGLTAQERHATLGRARKPIRHGTEAGYRMHLRRGDEACLDCRRAKVAANQRRAS